MCVRVHHAMLHSVSRAVGLDYSRFRVTYFSASWKLLEQSNDDLSREIRKDQREIVVAYGIGRYVTARGKKLSEDTWLRC